MKTLTHELSGYRIVRRIPLASDKDYVLLCAASTGGKKLVAWTLGEPHPANLPISLLGRNRLTAVAGDGTRFTPRIDSGRLLLDIGSAPQYLSLRGAVLK